MSEELKPCPKPRVLRVTPGGDLIYDVDSIIAVMVWRWNRRAPSPQEGAGEKGEK